LFSRILLEKFASRITNNEMNSVQQELDNIRKFSRLDNNKTEILLKEVKKKKY